MIYDPVGGDYAEPALRSIGWEGALSGRRLPGRNPSLPLNLTLLKSCDVCGGLLGRLRGATRPRRQCCARRRVNVPGCWTKAGSPEDQRDLSA